MKKAQRGSLSQKYLEKRCKIQLRREKIVNSKKKIKNRQETAILNLENNDLEGMPAANTLNNYLNCNQNILDLKLAGNKIGDTAMNKLVDFIRKGMS